MEENLKNGLYVFAEGSLHSRYVSSIAIRKCVKNRLVLNDKYAVLKAGEIVDSPSKNKGWTG